MTSREHLKNWIAAFQAGDVESVTGCYAEDAVNFQIATGEPAVGREQIAADTREFFKGFPDAWSRVENLIADGDRAAWEWVGGGTFLGEFYGHQPTGKTFEIRGCGFFTFCNELIILQHGYWDKLSWFTQVGLPIE